MRVIQLIFRLDGASCTLSVNTLSCSSFKSIQQLGPQTHLWKKLGVKHTHLTNSE